MKKYLIFGLLAAFLLAQSCGSNQFPANDPHGILALTNDKSFKNAGWLVVHNVETPALVCSDTNIKLKFDVRTKLKNEKDDFFVRIGDGYGNSLAQFEQELKNGENTLYSQFKASNSSDYYIIVYSMADNEKNVPAYIHPIKITEEKNSIILTPFIEKVWVDEFNANDPYYVSGYYFYLAVNVSETLPCEIKSLKIKAFVNSSQAPSFEQKQPVEVIQQIKDKYNNVIYVCAYPSEGTFKNEIGKEAVKRVKTSFYGIKDNNCIRNIASKNGFKFNAEVSGQGADKATATLDYIIEPQFTR